MFTIPRSVARQIAKVFRIALALTPAQAARQPISIDSDEQGATVFSQVNQFGIGYRLPGASTRERIVVPLGLFRAIGGECPDPVTIKRARNQVIQAQWQDGDVPQQAEWPKPPVECLSEPWSAPTKWVEQDGQLLQALADATATTDQESSRYALSCLQLRGTRGEIAATDGRQVLLQSGFTFDWEDDILVPGSKLFGYGELPRFPSIRIGRTESQVVLDFGPWRFWLAIETAGRFPRVDDIVPSPEHAATRVALESSDLRFLTDNLKRLPVPEGTHAPTTVELNGYMALRAQSEDKLQTTELVLSNSTRTGDEVRFVSDRRYVLRAAKLGFRELCVYSPQTPVICHDERRKYVWALWAPEDAIKPAAGAIQVASPKVSRATRARKHRVRKPARATMKRLAKNPLRISENALS